MQAVHVPVTVDDCPDVTSVTLRVIDPPAPAVICDES